MSQPWIPPVYADVAAKGHFAQWACQRCGTFIDDIIAHNRHHHALDQLRDGLVALTRIIAPGIPDGQLLEYLPDFPIELAAKLATEEGGHDA